MIDPHWQGLEWALAHPNPLTLSHSSLGTLGSCARRFEFFKFFRLPESNYEESPDTIAGHALHAGFQSYVTYGDKERAQYDMMTNFNVEGSPFVDHVRSLEACYGTLEAMMNNLNLMEYEIAQIKCLDGKTRPAIEVEFEMWLDGITIAGRPVVFVGFIDLALFHLMSQTYATMDVKTHRADQKVDRTAEYVYNAQQMPYSIVLQAVAGAPINRFEVLYFDVYVDIMEPKARVFRFQKTTADVEDWFTNLVLDVYRLRKYAEREHFPRRGHGCIFYRKACRFLPVCSVSDRKIAQGLLLMEGEQEEKRRARTPWIRLTLPMPTDV